MKENTYISGSNEIITADSGIFASTEFRKFALVRPGNINDFVNPNYQTTLQVSIPHMATADDLKAPMNETTAVSYDWQPRLLQISDVQDLPNGQRLIGRIKVYEPLLDSLVDTVTYLYKFIQLGFADTSFFGMDLSWNGTTGLYPRYYRDTVYNLAQGYTAECTVLMTPQDYKQMQINRPINYAGNIYLLKDISGFNPLRAQNIKVKLIKK